MKGDKVEVGVSEEETKRRKGEVELILSKVGVSFWCVCGERRRAEKSSAKQHLVPFETHEDGKSIWVMKMLKIEAPFVAESCVCSNEMVLARVQELIRKSR